MTKKTFSKSAVVIELRQQFLSISTFLKNIQAIDQIFESFKSSIPNRTYYLTILRWLGKYNQALQDLHSEFLDQLTQELQQLLPSNNNNNNSSKELTAQFSTLRTEVEREMDEFFEEMTIHRMSAEGYMKAMKLTEGYFEMLFQRDQQEVYDRKILKVVKRRRLRVDIDDDDGRETVRSLARDRSVKIKRIISNNLSSVITAAESTTRSQQNLELTFKQFQNRLKCHSRYRKLDELPNEGILVSFIRKFNF